jgi:hypothetical protein
MHRKYGKAAMAAKGITWAVVLVFGLALAYGNPDGEILKASPEQFDFGAIPEGEPAVATTSIENVGDSPVEITNVRTT